MATNLERFRAGQKTESNLQRFRAGQAVSTVQSTPLSDEQLLETQGQDYLQRQVASGNLVPDEPGLFQTIVNEFPQTAGGIVGGVQGTAFGLSRTRGAPPAVRAAAGLLGGVVGSFSGGFLGKAAQLGWKNSKGESVDFQEIMGDAAVAGFEEGLGEILGFGIGKVVGKGAKVLGRKFKSTQEGVQTAAKIVREGGTDLTFSQATNSKIARTVEGFVEKFVIGGGRLRRAKVKQQAGVRDVAAQIQEGFTGDVTRRFPNRQPGELLQSDVSAEIRKQFSPTEAGKIVRDALTGSKKTFQSAAQGFYRQVDKAIKIAGIKNKAVVDMTKIKKFLNAKFPRDANGKFIRDQVGESESSQRLAEKILTKWPDRFNFKQAGGMRTSLFLEGFDEATIAGKKSPTDVLASQLREMLTAEMDKAGMALPDKSMVEKWRLAREFYKEGSEKFNKKIVKDLDKNLLDNPELMADELFKPEGVTAIRNAKDALGVKTVANRQGPTGSGVLRGIEPKTWTAAKAGLISNIFKEATTIGEDGLTHINPVKFAEKLNSYGEEVLAETFSKADIERLHEFSSAIGILSRSPGKLPGEIAIPLLQIGAISAVALGNLTLPAAVTLGPAAVGKIAMNPLWTDIVINAAKPGASQGTILKLTNLVRRIVKDEKEEAKRDQQAKDRRDPRRSQLPPGSQGGSVIF